ncbi:succinate--CoA ligase subunit alpha [Pseudogracilibacillus sp. SE30717A]|uniref:succinate--CoA ligase subunit alpha n=1 Tax=Pseudogracilibacillus sp. SE30717A TaxID=3098293 RepID=UPI00300E4FE4
MAIIINEQSKIIIQGITGNIGQSFAKRMLYYNTPIVGGVTPGKGGQKVFNLPVFNTVEDAVKKTNADCSFISVRPTFVKQAVFEAIDAGIKVIVIYSEGVPLHDSLEMVHYAKLHQVILLGPNSAGIVSPEKANMSDIHDSILKPGNIGIVSRSGTLTYEVIEMLKQQNLGTSTIVCLGGDPVVGLQHYDVLEKFEEDPDTKAIVYVGEIGGNDEVFSAEIIKEMSKPVYSFIAGLHAPEGKRMGHAGAIIENESETAKEKQKILAAAGTNSVHLLSDLAEIKFLSENI